MNNNALIGKQQIPAAATTKITIMNKKTANKMLSYLLNHHKNYFGFRHNKRMTPTVDLYNEQRYNHKI